MEREKVIKRLELLYNELEEKTSDLVKEKARANRKDERLQAEYIEERIDGLEYALMKVETAIAEIENGDWEKIELTEDNKE